MATMLHWLAGAKAADPANNDSSACVDAPETPAPVFAVKAFRHALFGTPPTAQRPQPRRHSTTENRPRNVESPRAARPRMDRPKSANDANALLPPPASPTKGILVTPGTAAAKKKNVTFGDHVVDNQAKRPLKSGLPDDCPGKFPSPWTGATADSDRDGNGDKGRGRSKLTEALEQARDESRPRPDRSTDAAERRPAGEGRVRAPSDDENDCCEYWRREYDVYRTNTQREVKKLVKKYKAAKDYAQSKDDEAADLRLHLQEAESKADALEEAVNLLTAQLKDMEDKLRAQRPQQEEAPEALVPSVRQAVQQSGDRPRDLKALLERRGPREQRNVSASTARTTENDQLQRPSEPRAMSSRRALDRENQAQRSSEPEKPREEKSQLRTTEVSTTAARGARPDPAAARTPASIAARWAAVKDAPQRASEPGAEKTTEAETAATISTTHRQPEGAAAAAGGRATASTRRPPSQQPPALPAPAPTTTPIPPPASKTPAPPNKPDDLVVPSDPAIYTSPPPPAKHATVEDASDHSPPPPPPPPHARRDSGTTLRPMSSNARSGSGGEEWRGKPAPDAQRLEAAKARLRGRGRDVS